jgi:hypothetical protein
VDGWLLKISITVKLVNKNRGMKLPQTEKGVYSEFGDAQHI